MTQKHSRAARVAGQWWDDNSCDCTTLGDDTSCIRRPHESARTPPPRIRIRQSRWPPPRTPARIVDPQDPPEPRAPAGPPVTFPGLCRILRTKATLARALQVGDLGRSRLSCPGSGHCDVSAHRSRLSESNGRPISMSESLAKGVPRREAASVGVSGECPLRLGRRRNHLPPPSWRGRK